MYDKFDEKKAEKMIRPAQRADPHSNYDTLIIRCEKRKKKEATYLPVIDILITLNSQHTVKSV